MTLELKPLGNSCNLGCTYCYQEPMREAGNARASSKYDLELMMDMADRSGRVQGGYTLFGGEGLLLPKRDLEKIFRRSFAKYGTSSVQTNGTLIDDEHIELFKKYNVNVGLSIDGFADMNSLRKSAGKVDVDKLTKASLDSVKKLSVAGVKFSVIITIHKMNGTAEKIPRLIEFINWLSEMGAYTGVIHTLEVDSDEAAEYCLTAEESENVFMALAHFFAKEENSRLRYNPFVNMENLIDGDNIRSSCIWTSCNPLDTQSVYGIEGNGQLSNCGMVNKEGIEWTKSESKSNPYIRDIVLYQTPEEHGGCGGCRFFLACNGYCPGSSIDSDWRNRTAYCSTLKSVFSFYENKLEDEGKVPFSKNPDLKRYESVYMNSIIRDGNRLPMPLLVEEVNTLNKI